MVGLAILVIPARYSLVPRPLFFFLCGGGEKKGLVDPRVDLQYIFCAAGSTTFGDR